MKLVQPCTTVKQSSLVGNVSFLRSVSVPLPILVANNYYLSGKDLRLPHKMTAMSGMALCVSSPGMVVFVGTNASL
jgi:hypothetical protein